MLLACAQNLRNHPLKTLDHDSRTACLRESISSDLDRWYAQVIKVLQEVLKWPLSLFNLPKLSAFMQLPLTRKFQCYRRLEVAGQVSRRENALIGAIKVFQLIRNVGALAQGEDDVDDDDMADAIEVRLSPLTALNPQWRCYMSKPSQRSKLWHWMFEMHESQRSTLMSAVRTWIQDHQETVSAEATLKLYNILDAHGVPYLGANQERTCYVLLTECEEMFLTFDPPRKRPRLKLQSE